MMATKSLAIVQSHATQFDTGLFRLLGQNSVDLTVYYSGNDPLKPSFDSEIGQTSGWDFDLESGYKWKRSSDYSDATGFAQAICSAKHDLVVVCGYADPISRMILKVAKRNTTPVGFRSDSILMYKRGVLKSALKRLLLPRILKSFDTAHPTGTLARDYLEYYGIPRNRTYFYPYAVDNNLVQKLANQGIEGRSHLRMKLGIEKDAFVVSGAIKFVDREDPLTLVRGFGRFVEHHPDSHLILIGDGALRGAVEELISQNRIPNVHLTGYLQYSQFIKHLVASDVFVHPAVYEQWGVSVNEAMICRVPVITANTVGASKDLIVENESGMTFPAGDCEELAERLTRLATSTTIRHQIAEKAAASVDAWGYGKSITEFQRALREVRS